MCVPHLPTPGLEVVRGFFGGRSWGWREEWVQAGNISSPGDSDVLFNTVSVTIEMIWKEKYNPMSSTPVTLKGY